MGSVTQHQQPQQDVQVSRKRSSSTEQGDNGRSEKSKKLNEKNGTTRVDSKDGANMSIQVQQVTTRSQRTQKDPPCCLQSLLRSQRQERHGEPDGNLLKAGSERTQKTINVEFTGTRTDDPATEFHKERCPDKKAYVLRHSDSYYLKVKKSGGVNLRELVEFPTDDKYFFLIESCSGSEHVAIQSLKTNGWYLHCSDLGEVFMKEVTTRDNGAPEDVRTWFKFIPVEDVAQYTETIMTFNAKLSYSGIECEIQETTDEDVKDSGKEENSEEVLKEKENAENPEVGNSEAPEEDNCNEPESGKSLGAAKGSPEDQVQGHYGDL